MVFSDAPKAEEDEKLQKAKTRTIGLRSLAVTDGNAHDTELPEEEDDSQLTFEGFHTPEEKNTVDEREVEEELNKKRKEKAESFAKEITQKHGLKAWAADSMEEAVKLGDYIHLLSKDNRSYKVFKNPLKKPRVNDKNYQEFLEFIKNEYV